MHITLHVTVAIQLRLDIEPVDGPVPKNVFIKKSLSPAVLRPVLKGWCTARNCFPFISLMLKAFRVWWLINKNGSPHVHSLVCVVCQFMSQKSLEAERIVEENSDSQIGF